MVAVSPRIAAFLNQVSTTPDMELALWKVFSEYLDLKIKKHLHVSKEFEAKWGMTFAEFLRRTETNELGKDIYSYEVESDYWEWEAAETLLAHYRLLKSSKS